jgi:hypothetical protein
MIPGTDDQHFGITLTLDMPADFEGELVYREKLTLPARPAKWDELNQSLRELLVARTISPDGKSSTITERMQYSGGLRVLPLDGTLMLEYPTPFVIWDFDPAGDPQGEWTMECWVNERPVGKFAFQVIKER